MHYISSSLESFDNFEKGTYKTLSGSGAVAESVKTTWHVKSSCDRTRPGFKDHSLGHVPVLLAPLSVPCTSLTSQIKTKRNCSLVLIWICTCLHHTNMTLVTVNSTFSLLLTKSYYMTSEDLLIIFGTWQVLVLSHFHCMEKNEAWRSCNISSCVLWFGMSWIWVSD